MHVKKVEYLSIDIISAYIQRIAGHPLISKRWSHLTSSPGGLQIRGPRTVLEFPPNESRRRNVLAGSRGQDCPIPGSAQPRQFGFPQRYQPPPSPTMNGWWSLYRPAQDVRVTTCCRDSERSCFLSVCEWVPSARLKRPSYEVTTPAPEFPISPGSTRNLYWKQELKKMSHILRCWMMTKYTKWFSYVYYIYVYYICWFSAPNLVLLLIVTTSDNTCPGVPTALSTPLATQPAGQDCTIRNMNVVPLSDLMARV